MIGTGPRLQLLTPDADANNRIEHEFARWAKAVGMADKLRTMRTARATDGEAFAMLTLNPRLPTAVQLDLRLIEADQVCTPDLTAPASNSVDGIVLDEAGNPVEYHVLRRHPGEVAFGLEREFDRLPAAIVIHWYRADRPGQARGVPDIMPALPLFAQLRRFTLAVLAAAETAADFAGILYTDAPANGEADAAEPFEPIELEKRALVTMPGGWKMSQMEAEQPATTYAEFKREILNEIARCLNMPAKNAVREAGFLLTTLIPRDVPFRLAESRNLRHGFRHLGHEPGSSPYRGRRSTAFPRRRRAWPSRWRASSRSRVIRWRQSAAPSGRSALYAFRMPLRNAVVRASFCAQRCALTA